MPNITAKTSSNVFYKARCEAAKHNEQLSSREGAADIMSIHEVSPDGRIIRGMVSWDDLKFCGTVICGFDENGMEHVSVSSYKKKQIPTWEVMCRLKDMFWNESEQVVQIHPDATHYVHGFMGLENVLHLWRPINGDWSILNK